MASRPSKGEMVRDRWAKIHADCPESVNLLAVSKGHPASAVRELAALGQLDFGESRVQEALPKLEQLADLRALRWHFIGRLQANKVRSVIRAFTVIHSIDSQGLAERISRIALEETRIPEVFFQVKLRDDPAKGGWEPDALRELWPQMKDLRGIKPIGLMTMAPLDLQPVDRQVLFEECRAFANELALPDCSMGMSGDWKQAAQAGATWVRVGSGLFGSRPERPV